VKSAIGLAEQQLHGLTAEGSDLYSDGSGTGTESDLGTGSGANGSRPGSGSSGSGGSTSAGSGAAPSGPAANTTLGSNVDALVSQSPALARDVQALLAAGWTIRYTTGSETGSYADENRREIVVDSASRSNPAVVVQTLAHEVGHANHPNVYVAPSGLTRPEYVARNTDAQLAGEGAATLRNAEARAQILANGGPDIGIAGAQSAQYDAIYRQYAAGNLTRGQAEHQIGQLFGAGETTSNTNQSYRTYYGAAYEQAWDAAYAGQPPGFRAP
jgi:type VI secretion system secreted protein VgrG